MSTALQRGQLHKPARPVANAADITEMVRGLIRISTRPGCRPRRSVKGSPMSWGSSKLCDPASRAYEIPLPVDGGDAGGEPENVPPATGRRGVRPRGKDNSVKSPNWKRCRISRTRTSSCRPPGGWSRRNPRKRSRRQTVPPAGARMAGAAVKVEKDF
jgi:hypothetical protein